ELEQVFGLLRAAAAVLAGREGTRLERALRTVTLAALQEQLHLLATAAPAVGTGVTRHGSDPPTLRRTAAVVRLRRAVVDLPNFEPDGLQRTDGGLPARTRTLDEHVDLAHAVLHRAARGSLGGQLRGERRRLARTFEADLAGRRPRNHGAGRVGDRHDR